MSSSSDEDADPTVRQGAFTGTVQNALMDQWMAVRSKINIATAEKVKAERDEREAAKKKHRQKEDKEKHHKTKHKHKEKRESREKSDHRENRHTYRHTSRCEDGNVQDERRSRRSPIPPSSSNRKLGDVTPETGNEKGKYGRGKVDSPTRYDDTGRKLFKNISGRARLVYNPKPKDLKGIEFGAGGYWDPSDSNRRSSDHYRHRRSHRDDYSDDDEDKRDRKRRTHHRSRNYSDSEDERHESRRKKRRSDRSWSRDCRRHSRERYRNEKHVPDLRANADRYDDQAHRPAYLTDEVLKHASNIQARKNLWKKRDEPKDNSVSPSDRDRKRWEGSIAGIDADDSQKRKFKSLMGMHNADGPSHMPEGDNEDDKKPMSELERRQEMINHNMEEEFARARMATFMMRGKGLGFGATMKARRAAGLED